METAEGRIEQARALYERAVLQGDAAALGQAGDLLAKVEADLAVARGRLLHGVFLQARAQNPAAAREDPGELPAFERAASLYETLGDERGRGEALFWIGCCYQVVRRDNSSAVPVLEEALAVAGRAGDQVTAAEALRHLGIAELAASRPAQARARLRESTTLRRELGLDAGVAANLVGLAYVALSEGDRAEAAGCLDEAAALAESAHAKEIVRQVAEARSQL